MEKALRIIVVCFLALLLFSCDSNATKNNMLEIDNIESIYLSEPDIIIKDLIAPSDIISYDTLVFLCDRHSEDMVQAYSYNGQIISSFLKYGRGPGESTNILKIFNGFNHDIYANVSNGLIFVYGIYDILNGHLLPKKTISLPKGNASFSSISVLDSSLFYVGKNLLDINDNKTLYCIYDLYDNTMSHFGSLPIEDTQIENYPLNDFTIQTIYQGEPMCRPDAKKVIVPFYYSLGFEIIDVHEQKVEHSKFYTLPDVQIVSIPDINIAGVKKKLKSKVGFLDVRCTHDNFYLLYSGKNFGHPTYYQGNYILKYDWNGRLQNKYVLDREISSFCLSSIDNSFFCIQENESGSCVLKYHL